MAARVILVTGDREILDLNAFAIFNYDSASILRTKKKTKHRKLTLHLSSPSSLWVGFKAHCSIYGAARAT